MSDKYPPKMPCAKRKFGSETFNQIRQMKRFVNNSILEITDRFIPECLTGECTTQPALRATSSSVGVDFGLGRQLQRCYCSFVVSEICEGPAPLAEGN